MVKSCAVFTAFGSGALERAWTREGIGDSNDSTSWQGLCWQAGGNTEWGLHCGRTWIHLLWMAVFFLQWPSVLNMASFVNGS